VRKHLTLTYVPSSKKVSLKSQLEKVWEQTGVLPKRLEELLADIPSAGRDLWTFFWEIKTAEELTWTEVLSYSTYTGVEFELWEVQLFFAMNAEYNKYVHSVEMPKKDNSKAGPKKR
jgi:hypothetical protein